MIPNIPYPANFGAVDSVQHEPIGSGPECGYKWYFAVFGKLNVKDPNCPALQYVFRWLPGDPVAELVPLERYTTARGSLGVGSGGKGLWIFGHDEGKKQAIQPVPGWTPPLWMRAADDVAALRAQVEGLQRQIVELTQIGGGGLSAGDRLALNRLKVLAGIEG